MALVRNDGKNSRSRRKDYPFTVSRDGKRIVTDRETGTVLGDVTPYGNRWDYNSELVPVGRPMGYETITDAAQALHWAWRKNQN